MSESPRAPPGGDASAFAHQRALLQRAEDLALRSADVAEAVASNLEVLAATYRRMAEVARLPRTTERLLEHVARLEAQVVHERAAAVWFRHMVGPSSRIP